MDTLIVEFMSGPLDGQTVVLHLDHGVGTFLLGRREDCAVVIPADEQVSRHHARLAVQGQNCTLEDLASRNGTFWEEDGRPLAGPEPLPERALFRVGRTRLRVYR